MSQEGYEKLLGELLALKDEKRPKAVDRLAAARAMGDLSENSEYTAARSDLDIIDARISEIEKIKENVQIVNEKKHADIVQLGDTIKVMVQDGHEEFSIVGEMEADITKGHISDTSPIGQALLGAKKGSVVTVTIPAGEVTYKVVEIRKS